MRIAAPWWRVVRAGINAPLSAMVAALAVAGGARCTLQRPELLLVCRDAPRWMYRRHGTTVGGVYLTCADEPTVRELAHEACHADQWAIGRLLFGPAGIAVFAAAYLTAELVTGGARNPFERWAGLEDGNYRQ